MNLLRTLFGKQEIVKTVKAQVETKPKKPVLNYTELSKIAASNAKNIQGNINQAYVMLNGIGIRAGKKYIVRIKSLKKKLEEEEFYADYYNRNGKYHSSRVRQEGNVQH